MKRKQTIIVVLKPYNHKSFYENKIFNLDNKTNAFFGLKDELQKYGIEINTIDVKKSKSPDMYIFADLPYPWEIKLWLIILFNRKKKLLFCLESPLINPFNHFKFLFNFFDRVYTWNDEMVDNQKVFKLFIPQMELSETLIKSGLKSKKFMVCVLANKKAPRILEILNPFKSQNYKFRNEAISFFENKLEENFELYGRGWNRLSDKTHPSYKSELENDDKIKTLSRFKFCVAIENADAPGYITEKIFDCFKAGCVPIYLGAGNVNKYIPEDSYIDIGKYESFDKLTDYILTIDEAKLNSYLEAGKRFIQDKNTLAVWSQESFVKKLIRVIKTD